MPCARSICPGELEVIGEVRAGESFSGEVGAGQAVEIMTGAPVPRGADAVVMIETRAAGGQRVIVDRRRRTAASSSIRKDAEARAGRDRCCDAGKRLDFTDVAMLAAVGQSAGVGIRRAARGDPRHGR